MHLTTRMTGTMLATRHSKQPPSPPQTFLDKRYYGQESEAPSYHGYNWESDKPRANRNQLLMVSISILLPLRRAKRWFLPRNLHGLNLSFSWLATTSHPYQLLTHKKVMGTLHDFTSSTTKLGFSPPYTVHAEDTCCHASWKATSESLVNKQDQHPSTS